jgi:type IV pilus assembly protein PilA
MKRMQQGFTLIELMIVVAIIGILAAIAIPQYAEYTNRARVSEGLQLAAGAKTSVAEYYSANNKFPNGNADAGVALAGQIKGNNVTSVTVGPADGKLTILYAGLSANICGAAAPSLVLLGADAIGSITWTKDPATTVDVRCLPANLR